MSPAMAYAILSILALCAFCFFPVGLGRFIKALLKDEPGYLYGFFLSLSGFCIWIWLFNTFP